MQVICAFNVKGWRQFAGWLLIGAFYIVAGLFAFANPLLASTILTLLFSLSIITAGAMRIVTGFALRPAQGWGWLGCVDKRDSQISRGLIQGFFFGGGSLGLSERCERRCVGDH